ncbi:MAG: N-acetylornithine carbamoyltransferase [Elusimicrobia bacterium]|nr:N-acetylornithine carbamoyltransferase [Elusimicrobiota bacterium]
MSRHFTNLHEWGAEGLARLVDRALALKAKPNAGLPLAGKTVALCFMNPSLRTQVSFEAAAAALGAHPITLFIGQGTYALEWRDGVVMDGLAAEHVREAVPVLSRMCDALALRCFPEGKDWAVDKQDGLLNAFRRHATVPVISLESALGHPCQALADLMTIRERMEPRRKKFLLAWAPHIKASPQAVPSSAVEMAALAGMDVTVLRPEGYDLDVSVMGRVRAACEASGAKFEVTGDIRAGYAGARVVYAKSWGSLERYGQAPDAALREPWRVTASKLALTDDAIFMHCLPVRRGLKVEDSVLDGPSSVVIDQAENRLHTAKAVLLELLATQVPEELCPTSSAR